MAPCSTAMLAEAKSPQVKYKGIHEPKGRVKGFRVEIRPPGSSKKIWVGTFDTRVKAMRAFDAAVYLTGKEPFYFVYPEGYFSSCPPSPSKEVVQTLAKQLAEKTDALTESLVFRLGASSKAGQAKNVGSERTSPNTTVVKKVAEKMNSPPAPLKTLQGLDQFLQDAEYLEVPTLLDLTSLDYLPVESEEVLEESKFDLEKSPYRRGFTSKQDIWKSDPTLPDLTSFDCLPVESEEVLEESKVDLETSAYRRGFTSKLDIWKSLPDVPLLAPYDFPAIEDESFYLNFDPPLKVSSKRKRGVSQEIDDFTCFVEDLGFSEDISAVEEDWCHSFYDSWV